MRLLPFALLSILFTLCAAEEPARQPSAPPSEVFVQMGHSSAISRMAVSPDGRFLATAGKDGAVKLWDTATQRLIYTYRGHVSLVNAIAFTPDGGMLITAAANPDNRLHVIDRKSGRLLRQLLGHTGGVQDVAVLPDGHRALSVAEDGGQAILWNITSGKMLAKWKYDLDNLRSVAVMPDGRHAMVGSWSGRMALISLPDGRLLREFTKQELPVEQIAVHPKGESFFVAVGGRAGQMGGGGIAGRWTLVQEGPERQFEGPGSTASVMGIAVSPDGRHVAVGASYSTLGIFNDSATTAETAVWVWDADTGVRVAHWPMAGGANGVTALAFSPTGHTIYFATGTENLVSARRLDAPETAVVHFGGRKFGIRHLAVAPDGRSVWASSSIRLTKSNATMISELPGRFRLMRWDLATGMREDANNVHGKTIDLLAFAGGSGPVSISGGHSSDRYPPPDDLAEVHATPGAAPRTETHPTGWDSGAPGATLLTPLYRRISPDVEASESIILYEGAKSSVALSATGHLLAVPFRSSNMRSTKSEYLIAIYERVGEKRRLQAVHTAAGKVAALAFTRDEAGFLVAMCEPPAVREGPEAFDCTRDRGLRLHRLQLASGQWVAHSEHLLPVIDQISLSPDGIFAMTTGSLPSVFRTDTLALAAELRAPRQTIRNSQAAAWSPDQRRLAVASHGRTIDIWDTDKMMVLRTITGYDGFLKDLAYSPDGKRLFAIGDDGMVRIWDAESGALIATMTEFDDGEWITVIPEGYFMGSTDADRQLNVRHGDRVYGMNQFYDLFYRPDIVRRKLAGERIDDLIGLTIKEALRKPPPQVTVRTEPTKDGIVSVMIDASDTGGGVGALRAYHNGKLVASDDEPRGASVAAAPRPAAQDAAGVRGMLAASARKPAPAPTRRQRLRKVDVRLAPGENRVWVTGFNADGSIQSRPVMVDLPAQPAAAPRVFVLAVGVDRYRNTEDIPTLRYAVKDAQTFTREMRERMARVYPHQPVEVRLLADDKATVADLQRELERLRTEMRPGDVFVWFIASHGMLDGNSAYNVVLHDADLDRPGQGVLSADRLIGWLKRLPALDQMVVIDTCHAGGLDGTVRGLYDARLGVLARSMGLHILASASATEEAIDGYKENGLFTHSMLRAMGDPTSDTNADRRLSVTEFGSYARALTQRIAREMRFSQTPLVFHYGRDLVVSEFSAIRRQGD